MPRLAWILLLLCSLTAALALAPACSTGTGSATPTPDGDDDATDTPTPTPIHTPTMPARITDYGQRGSHVVSTFEDSEFMNGCYMDFTLYTPSNQNNAPLVVLGHGFNRDPANMAAFADYLASHGLRVATPKYCHSTFVDADHAQNGADAAVLAARNSGGAPVVHMGYSAGGASAFVAASQDTGAVGVMGLDPVDSGGAAMSAAALIGLPAFSVFGESSLCNDNSNGLPLLDELSDGWGVRVNNATHCDFENPTDGGCDFLCGASDPNRQQTVMALAAAYAAWVTGVDISGRDWVLPTGGNYQRLVTSGFITGL